MPNTTFTASRRETSTGDVVVGHSSRVMQLGLAGLLGDSLGVVAAGGTVDEVCEQLEIHTGAAALIEADLPGGGALAVIARQVRQGDRPPVVAIVDPAASRRPPWGFCQAAVDTRGDETRIPLALEIVRAGGTYLDPALHEQLAPSGADQTAGLTPRELQVVRAIADGQGSKQIAFSEGIGVETVKTHVSNVMRKLSVGTRAHAVAEAYERGLLGEDLPLVARSTIAGLRHPETMLYATYAEAAGAVLSYLQKLIGFDVWVIAESLGGNWVTLQSIDLPLPATLDWSDSLCRRMVDGEGPNYAPDLDAEECYRDTPVVQSLGLRSYLGVRLDVGDAAPIATLCAFGREPREQPITDEQMQSVGDCATLLAAFAPQPESARVGRTAAHS